MHSVIVWTGVKEGSFLAEICLILCLWLLHIVLFSSMSDPEKNRPLGGWKAFMGGPSLEITTVTV